MDYKRPDPLFVTGKKCAVNALNPLESDTLTIIDRTVNSLSLSYKKAGGVERIVEAEIFIDKKDYEYALIPLPDGMETLLHAFDFKDPVYFETFSLDGHDGTYHVEDSFEYDGNRFYLCRNNEFNTKTADVITNSNNIVIAEDLWNGFDHDAVLMIRDHLKENGIDMPYSMVPARGRFFVSTIFPDPGSDDYKFAVYDSRTNRIYTDGKVNHILADRNAIDKVCEHKNNTLKEVYDYVYIDSKENQELHKNLMRQSYRQNGFCAREMTEMINKCFDGMHLDTDCVDRMLEAYGADRVGYILASTVKYHDWDGRFSSANKEWAENFFSNNSLYYDVERVMDYCVASHPAVLNGAVTAYREKAPFYKALDMIDSYCYEKFGEGADFSDLSDISLAFTTIDNEELGLYDIPIQASVDLINCRMTQDVGACGELFVRQYENIESLINSELYWMSFEGLFNLPDEAWNIVAKAEEALNSPVVNEEEIPPEELPGYKNMTEPYKGKSADRSI